MSDFSLESHGLTVKDVRRNLSPATLYSEAIREEPDCVIADSGALIAYSHDKTGRSPKDKRVVKHPGYREGRLVGVGKHPDRRDHVSRSTWSGPRTISTPASTSIASMRSRAGIRAIGQRCESSARGRTMHCSCTTC